MSLRSKMQILDDNANSENATDSDILKAALVETQDKYNQLSAKLTMDMEALKAAVERSNREKDINIQSAMKNASEAILSDLKGVVDSYKAEVEQATERLQAATKKKDDNEKKEIAIFLAGVFGVVFAAFYLSLLCYGWWYDIPEAVGGITQHNTLLEAINNGIYQLLQR
jgi:hypothetical protein